MHNLFRNDGIKDVIEACTKVYNGHWKALFKVCFHENNNNFLITMPQHKIVQVILEYWMVGKVVIILAYEVNNIFLHFNFSKMWLTNHGNPCQDECGEHHSKHAFCGIFIDSGAGNKGPRK